MSIDTSIAALDAPVKGPAKAVLLALAIREGRSSRESFPSIDRLAADTGLSAATVKRAVVTLERFGVLRVTRHKRSVNHYSIDLKAARSDLSQVSARSVRGLTAISREGSRCDSKGEEKGSTNLSAKGSAAAPMSSEQLAELEEHRLRCEAMTRNLLEASHV